MLSETPAAPQPMIPTFVFGWPTGKETGDYLALDLGGTNLRVCLVTLGGDGKFELTQTKYRLTEEQKQQEGEKLFDFCAECVAGFVNANIGDADGLLKKGQEVSLGFTVSRLLISLFLGGDTLPNIFSSPTVLVSLHVCSLAKLCPLNYH